MPEVTLVPGEAKERATVTKNKGIRGWLKVSSGAVYAMIVFFVWGGFAPALRGQERTRPAEDHLAVAARYRQEAAELREAIKRHQIALDVYRKGSEEPHTAGFNPQGRKRMVQHCERVIAYYTETAKELEAMAEAHEAAAKQPQGVPPR